MVAQQLVRRADGRGRVAVHEILISSPGLSNLIREAKSSQIPNYIQTGRGLGMQTIDGTLRELATAGVISWETARERCMDPLSELGP